MKKFTSLFKIIGIALVIGLGVSVVSAWTAPATGSTAPTAGTAISSINLGIFDQIKKGGITIPTAGEKFVSPLSFFKKTLLPGNDTSVYIGGAGDATGTLNAAGWGIQFPGNRSVPMTINLAERAKPTDAVKFKTDQMCAQTTKLINTSASGFEFWNTSKNTNADVLAGGIRLDGGNPAAGKILIAVDNKGRAVWATPKLASNGKDIIFDTHADSPVGLCTDVTIPTDPDVCTNLGGSQASVPAGYHVDPVGSTTCVRDLVCPSGQYAQGGQCLCGSGIREGQLPGTVTTTGKIITYENSVNQNPGGSGAPLVPYYVVLDELRHNGGPGNSCQIKAFDAACPAFDLDTVNSGTSFTLDGVTYATTGGNSWQIDSKVGDQCIMNEQAQIGSGLPLIMMDITR